MGYYSELLIECEEQLAILIDDYHDHKKFYDLEQLEEIRERIEELMGLLNYRG